MSFTPPPNALGADLFWWREDGGVHTLVTIHGLSFDGLLDDVVLECVLFDASGSERARWQIAMHDRPFVAIASERLSEWTGAPSPVADGVLAVYTHGTHRPGLAKGDKYRRLYSMVDWYSERDGLSGLHNDQSVVPGRDHTIDLTEIAILETIESRNSLVIVNGDLTQAPRTLSVTVTNSGGVVREAFYEPPMLPFTVHQIRLAQLFPQLDAFGGGEHISVGGRFEGQGMYLRPYVVTEGPRFSAYHGGDVYQFKGLPAFHYRLLGNGEVNPMAVLHRPGEVETTVNLFNSHGSVEAAFWVDAELYDAAGTLVARKEKWRCARRQALVRGDLVELIPDAAKPFSGHISLSFSPCDAPEYPHRLQALLEYRSAGGAARVMAWSDEWNSRIRLHVRRKDGALPLRSYYRALAGRGFTTYASVTNAGHAGYAESAPYTITLIRPDGGRLETSGTLGPRETLFAGVEQLLPGAAAFLAPGGVGMLEVESTYDLANVQFVRHDATGTWGAEHYMAATTRAGDRIDVPAGS